MSESKRKRVVVVGGGFAGRRAHALLSPDFDVALVDAKGYYEYTPANLRCLVQPGHATCTVMEQPRAALLDAVADVVPGGGPGGAGVVHLRSGARLSYDYCVLCCGSDYAPPVKAPQGVQASAGARRREYRAAHAELAAARSVLIIGGGDVGVELAAEVAGAWRGRKQVTLVTSKGRLLERMPAAASRHAAAWLRRRGVRLVLGQRARRGPSAAAEQARGDKDEPGHESPAAAGAAGVVLADGRRLTADLAFWCAGERPCAPAFPGLAAPAASGGSCAVLPTLQLAGAPAVLAAGDCALPAGQRTAFGAELSAGLAARNVRRLAAGRAPLRFPKGACHGAAAVPVIAAVSLHRADGVLQFNRLVLRGRPAAATKWLVEYLQVNAARGSWLHGVAWDCFEAVGVWLGAYCFR